MKGQIALALIVALGTMANTKMASATELVRRAPVHTESHDSVVAAQGHQSHPGHAPKIFPGGTGCCETQPGCCDNIWDGYCGSRTRWCDHPYQGIFPGWGRHGHKDSCQSCSSKTACGHSKQGGCGKSCGGFGCNYAFGLVAAGPCGCRTAGKGHATHWPKIHMPKIHMPKIHMPKIHLPKVHMPKISFPQVHMPKFGKGHAPKMRWPKLTGKNRHVCHDGCGCDTVVRQPYTKGPGYGYQKADMAAPVYLSPEEVNDSPLETAPSPVETTLDSDNTSSDLGPTDPTARRNFSSRR